MRKVSKSKIELMDGYYLTTDKYNYIVNNGGRQSKYYGTLTDCIKGTINCALREKISDGRLTSLQEIVESIARLNDKVDTLFRPLDEQLRISYSDCDDDEIEISEGRNI